MAASYAAALPRARPPGTSAAVGPAGGTMLPSSAAAPPTDSPPQGSGADSLGKSRRDWRGTGLAPQGVTRLPAGQEGSHASPRRVVPRRLRTLGAALADRGPQPPGAAALGVADHGDHRRGKHRAGPSG